MSKALIAKVELNKKVRELSQQEFIEFTTKCLKDENLFQRFQNQISKFILSTSFSQDSLQCIDLCNVMEANLMDSISDEKKKIKSSSAEQEEEEEEGKTKGSPPIYSKCKDKIEYIYMIMHK